MAHQDYVARPRATKKKKNPYKPKAKKQAQKPSMKPLIILAIIVVLVSGFVFSLNFMSDNAPDVEVAEIKMSDQKTAVIEDILPEIPTEKWTYMDGLKNKEVEVGDYEVKEKGPYQMQCGSFRKQQQAEELKANIAFAGLGSNIRKTNGKNGVWYKVVLGPFERKRMAESAKHKLKRNKINYCQIWLWT
ncbi:SPOR domain-containing protein [Thalassotalea psychrophila]|uniref:SPOR domain-containing protein n=1 Tax=Thalassotalea psychrophila TaxID=3065647 RepID=A0ABY9TSA5_9GAMM|nr:SPOR domain-containing protein [Colwelliaceae bacterium SQ149]